MGASKNVPGLEREVEKLYRQEQEAYYGWSVSFLDLVEDELYKKWINTLDQSEGTVLINSKVGDNMVLVNYRRPPDNIIKSILFKLGMDVTDNYEEQTLVHRRFNGDVVNTLRWVGKLRTDNVWEKLISSGKIGAK